MKITKITRKAKIGERLADFEKEPKYKVDKHPEITEVEALYDLEIATNAYNHFKDKVANKSTDPMMPVYDEEMATRMMNEAEEVLNTKQAVVDEINQLK